MPAYKDMTEEQRAERRAAARAWYHKNHARARASVDKYHRENPEKIRKHHLKANAAKYGLTVNQFNSMVEAQKGVCAICFLPPRGRWKKLGVDHCHKTGKVRGPLCHQCNVVLGYMKDSPSLLRAAADFLERTRG